MRRRSQVGTVVVRIERADDARFIVVRLPSDVEYNA